MYVYTVFDSSVALDGYQIWCSTFYLYLEV